MARDIGPDHESALQLWKLPIRETRILAGMIGDPKMVTEEMMEVWVRDFDYWEICDQCIMNLFGKTEFAYPKAMSWSREKEEFVKRAGFVLMARLAVSDKKAANEVFESFFPAIRREAVDDRNYVKKAVNWALRQIGKRNPALNRKAIREAGKIDRIQARSARWIAADALRELTSPAVQQG